MGFLPVGGVRGGERIGWGIRFGKPVAARRLRLGDGGGEGRHGSDLHESDNRRGDIGGDHQLSDIRLGDMGGEDLQLSGYLPPCGDASGDLQLSKERFGDSGADRSPSRSRLERNMDLQSSSLLVDHDVGLVLTCGLDGDRMIVTRLASAGDQVDDRMIVRGRFGRMMGRTSSPTST